MPRTRRTTAAAKRDAPPSDQAPATPSVPPASDLAGGPASPPEPVQPAPPATPLAGEQPSASPERVRLGQVEGLLHHMSVGAVQDILVGFEDRIDTLRSSHTIADLQARMRATEGRCAPLYFTERPGGKPPALVAGIETLAAAMNLGLDCVFVVTVASDDAGAVQDFIAASATKGEPAETDDDFLMQVSASIANKSA